MRPIIYRVMSESQHCNWELRKRCFLPPSLPPLLPLFLLFALPSSLRPLLPSFHSTMFVLSARHQQVLPQQRPVTHFPMMMSAEFYLKTEGQIGSQLI